MKRMSHSRACLISSIAALGTILPVGAAEVSLQAPQAVYAGEPFELRVVVSDFERAEQPVIPDIAGVNVQFIGPSEQTSIVTTGGVTRTSRTRTLRYSVTASTPGMLQIPSISVLVDGDVRRTARQQILVRELETTPSTDKLWAVITADAPRFYVGQIARLQLEIWVEAAEFGAVRLNPTQMYDMFDPRTSFGRLNPPNRADQRVRNNPAGERVRCYVYTSTTDLTLTDVGSLDVGNLILRYNYPTRVRRNVFGDIRVTGAEALVVRPTQPQVTVLPLPTAGRPPGFNGAVGVYTLEVSAAPTQVRVGDPVTLTLTVRGDGDLTTLAPPDLDRNEMLNASFRIANEPPGGVVEGEEKRFTAIVRPTSPRVTEVPPIEFPFFNPRTERYEVARSNAVNIEVTRAASIDASEIEGLASDSDAGPAPAVDGLPDIETRENRLLASHRSVGLVGVALGLTAPALAFLLLLTTRRALISHGADAAARRRGRAAQRARARLQAAETLAPREAAAEASATLNAYLADRLNAPRGHGWRELESELVERGLPSDLRDALAQLIERCAAAAYAGATNADAAEIIETARSRLQQVEGVRL